MAREKQEDTSCNCLFAIGLVNNNKLEQCISTQPFRQIPNVLSNPLGKTKSAFITLSRASGSMTDVTPNFAQYNEYISGESSRLVEFRGIGITKSAAFIPLLEDAFSWHPSLFEFLKNKRLSDSYRGWALTILGQVLHFLNIKKMRDMDKEACDDLQSQWDELREVGFDLTWLKPFVDTALLAKDVRCLRQKVAGLEKNLKTVESEMSEQVKILKEKVAAVYKDLEIAKEKLFGAEKSLAEIDLDAIIGFGGPTDVGLFL